MSSCRLIAAFGPAILVAFVVGCSSYYKDINDVTGVTEEDLKKSMEASASEGPAVVQATAEETIGLLLDPDIGSSAADVLKATKRRLIGKVLEVSPEGSETPFVVLDGGMHGDLACKIKCSLAKGQGADLKGIQVGDEIRIT